ncbi:MAG: NAD-dependent epimerase/dehydratase family protein [Geminicoccaceae bacterium]
MAETAARLLLVGQNSFIARHLLKILPGSQVVARSHGDIDDPGLLDGIDVVINCARHPASNQDEFDLERLDPDLALARKIGERDIAFIMLSSRKVYAPSEQQLSEEAPLGPTDAYGRNKLLAERCLGERLGDRLTVLRLANIFGNERLPGRRTFLALTLNRLADHNQIRYDMSPFVERDFLPVEVLAEILAKIVWEPPGGVMNVGSGIALATGRIALWILEGYGGGELLIGSHREKDRFVLDIARLQARYGRPCTLGDLKTRCLDLGRQLREAQQVV